MKKKIMFLSLVFALSASTVLAQGVENRNDNAGVPELTQEEKDNGQGSAVQENRPESPRGDGTDDSVQVQEQNQIQEQERINEPTGEFDGEQARQQDRAGNTEQLREMIANKKQEMNQEVQGIENAKQRSVYQNQNRISEAVHALLAAENLAGGVGSQISEIAREFNNSVQKTIVAEEKIQSRSGLIKFFFGGDKDATEEILQETNKNQEKIQQLKNFHQECDCDPEVKNIIQEQIQNLGQEQVRLGQVAQEEKSNKGIFGWLFGWMR